MNYHNNSGGRGGYQRPAGNQRSQRTVTEIKATSLPRDYLEQAESLMQQKSRSITTSKIRRIYSLVTEIYNEERLRTDEELSADSISAVAMMRVRIAYEAGRDPKVKDFVIDAHLLDYLKGIGTKRKAFLEFTQYMEALIAYHKFFGGREN